MYQHYLDNTKNKTLIIFLIKFIKLFYRNTFIIINNNIFI